METVPETGLMKIAIDARWIFPHISGIGAYTRELIRNLAILDADNEYLLIFADPVLLERTVAETQIAGHPNFRTEIFPHGVFSPRSQLLLPGLLHRKRVDVFHSTNYMIPLPAFPRRGGSIRCVITIHDVIPLIFPHHAPRSKKSRLFPIYKALMREIGRRASMIITDSEASRTDILKHLRMTAGRTDRVRVAHCGVGADYTPAPAGRPPSTPRTVLYVGRADPYKNLATLIHAFTRARRDLPDPVRLRIVGADDPRYPEPRALARQLGVDEWIEWTGYLSDSAMVQAYRDASVLVHPSRYEGFGLQVIEAMASGLPVICSRGGSLPEVAGEAALLHEANDVPGFAESIRRVLSDPSLAAALRAKGLVNAARFTWERTVREVLAVYESVR